MRQELFWMEWVPDDSMVGGKFKFVPIDKKPTSIWTLYHYRDQNIKPQLPYKPIHHHNAFIEDHVHDWNIYNGMLKFYTRAIDCSCWILLEYEN